MASVTDLAWAAGFLDADGCVKIQRLAQKSSKNPAYSLRISVGQTRREPLEKFQLLFGGTIYERKMARLTNGVLFEWGLSAENASKALTRMLPYLVLKRDQAKLGIEFHQGLNEYRASDLFTGVGRGHQTPPKEMKRREKFHSQMKLLKVEVS